LDRVAILAFPHACPEIRLSDADKGAAERGRSLDRSEAEQGYVGERIAVVLCTAKRLCAILNQQCADIVRVPGKRFEPHAAAEQMRDDDNPRLRADGSLASRVGRGERGGVEVEGQHA
jgi:hypothetical protein